MQLWHTEILQGYFRHDRDEGWLVVFDPQFGDWDSKLRHEDVVREGKTLHVFFC